MSVSAHKYTTCLLSHLDNMFNEQELVSNNFQVIVDDLQQQSFNPDKFVQMYNIFFASALLNVKHNYLSCLYGYLQGKTNELQELYPYERLIGNIANLINQQLYKVIQCSYSYDILLDKRGQHFLKNSEAVYSRIQESIKEFLADIYMHEKPRIVAYFSYLFSPKRPSILVLGNTDILVYIINKLPLNSYLYFAELAPDCFGRAMLQNVSGTSLHCYCYLLADSAVAGLMPRFEAVLVNCRHVYKSGACYLDPGALSIVEVANYYRKPVFVPVQSAQVCRDDVRSEFLCYKHGNLLPGGDYCDGAFIDYYVMYQGVYSPGTIFKWVEENL